MDIFSESSGISASLLAGFISWLLSGVVIIFASVAIKGMYKKVIDGGMDYIEVFISVTLLVALVTGVGSYFS